MDMSLIGDGVSNSGDKGVIIDDFCWEATHAFVNENENENGKVSWEQIIGEKKRMKFVNNGQIVPFFFAVLLENEYPIFRIKQDGQLEIVMIFHKNKSVKGERFTTEARLCYSKVIGVSDDVLSVQGGIFDSDVMCDLYQCIDKILQQNVELKKEVHRANDNYKRARQDFFKTLREMEEAQSKNAFYKQMNGWLFDTLNEYN